MAMMTNEEIIFKASCDLVRAGLLDMDEENGVEEIHTYDGWKERGYQVQKGCKAVARISIWKQGTKKPKEGEEKGKSFFFLKDSCFFRARDVAPIAG